MENKENLTEKSKVNKVFLSNYEDITAYDIGQYEYIGNRWVNFGKDNDYPEFLRNLYLNSPTHQAIVDGVQNLATGDGVEVVDPAKNPLSNKWLNENFPKEVVKKLIGDLKMYGYAVCQIYDGSLIKYSEAIKYRFAPKCEDEQPSIWYCEDWNKYNTKAYKPVKLPIYQEGTDEPISILIVQLDKKSFTYYSPVDYNGAINYIALETEISKYHLSNIKNGLAPSFSISFIGDFTDEQMKEIENKLNKKFSGTSNTGRIIVGFSDNPDNRVMIDTIEQPNIDATYSFLSKECSDKILIGHGVTSPLLFGITRDTGNGLGSNAEELSQSYYLFYESKLKHYQNYILEMITKIMNGNLLYAPIQFKTYNPFAVNNNTQKLSKLELINEVDSQIKLSKIDENKIKTDDILINEKIFDGKLNEKALYKFVKSSNNNNIVNKKYELLSKQGYLFKPNEEIVNTSDYYFMEQIYLKKSK